MVMSIHIRVVDRRYEKVTHPETLVYSNFFAGCLFIDSMHVDPLRRYDFGALRVLALSKNSGPQQSRSPPDLNQLTLSNTMLN